MSEGRQEQLRIGLLGFSGLGDQDHQSAMYLPALRARGDVRVTAVAAVDRADQATAEATAHGLGLEAESGPDALLERDDVDAVVVCAPSHLRADLVRASAAAGRHVLADKPLALTADEVVGIRDAARATGVIVAVAQHLRLHPMVVPLVGALRAGRVGLPWSVQADFVVAGGARVEKDELANLGVYPVDLVQAMLGLAPRRVFASRAARGSSGEAFVLMVDHDNGVTSTMLVARTEALAGEIVSAPVVHRYRVAGALGTLSADLTGPSVSVVSSSGRTRTWVDGSTVDACVGDFVTAARTGRAPACGTADALVSAAVLDAARASLDTGQPCPVLLPMEES